MLEVALINGSPKVKDSASGAILSDLSPLLKGATVREVHLRSAKVSASDLDVLKGCKVWIFAFPLYVDAIPSHLLSCLVQLEEEIRHGDIQIYGIVNCGFYEGNQARHALRVLKHFSQRSNVLWGMGVGYGGGGGLASMSGVPLGKGPKKSLGKALNILAENVLNRTHAEDCFASVNIPRWAYRAMAEWGWRRLIKANGKKVRDLKHRA